MKNPSGLSRARKSPSSIKTEIKSYRSFDKKFTKNKVKTSTGFPRQMFFFGDHASITIGSKNLARIFSNPPQTGSGDEETIPGETVGDSWSYQSAHR